MLKEKQSNFELMRIFSIFFIILWHIILHGKIFSGYGEPYDFITRILIGILIVHVNSLVFLTGYFSGEKKTTKPSKILRLLGTGWLYNVIILAILIFGNFMVFPKVQVMIELSPLHSTYWFFNCYAIIYLLSPYLNKVTMNMTKKDYQKFLALIILLLCFIPIFTDGVFIKNDGYNIIHFVTMYYIGSYFKRFPIKENLIFKNIPKRTWLFLLVFAFFFIVATRIGFFYLGEKMELLNSKLIGYWGTVIKKSFTSYASVLVILQTVVYCLFFESITIKTNKIINYMASTTLGIYFIHDNYNLRMVLYKWLDVTRFGASKKAILLLFVMAIIIYVGCFLIESLRKAMTYGIVWSYKKIKNRKKRKVK